MVCNDLLMEFSQLSQSLGARLVSFGSGSGFSSVNIDSRLVTEGSLFVALEGEVSDGHRFTEAAFKNGAAAALVESKKCEQFNLESVAEKYEKTLVIVEDSLKGLQEAARTYLKKFPNLKKIGITGSSGKTTTKEITASVIGAEKCVIANPGNYNSEIGLPLAVFSVRSCHEIGVFEAGMNKRGEMAVLASILKPNIALITCIGFAHIGCIGSIEGIAKEKKQIFSFFDENCIALVPDESAFRDFLAEGVKGRVSFFGEKTLAQFGGAKSLGLDGYEILWNGEKIHFPLAGRHNLANALASLAIACEIPVSDLAVKQGLESVQPLFGRGEILRGRATVIRDCYNSNPESLAAAVEFCDNPDIDGRRIYVIGEMLELGEESQKSHEEAGRLLSGSKAALVLLYGEEAAAAASAMKDGPVRFFHTCDMGELSRLLKSNLLDGDIVLLKGSRGCALEKLTEVCGVSPSAEVC